MSWCLGLMASWGTDLEVVEDGGCESFHSVRGEDGIENAGETPAEGLVVAKTGGGDCVSAGSGGSW